MGLESFIGGSDSEKEGVKWSKPKLHKDSLCPRCGKDDTEQKEYYWRCRNSNCEVVTYLKTKR